MSRTIPGQFADILAAVDAKRNYGIVGANLRGPTDATRRQGEFGRIRLARGGEVEGRSAAGFALEGAVPIYGVVKLTEVAILPSITLQIRRGSRFARLRLS